MPSSESSVEGTSVESSSVPEGGTSLPGDPENGQNGQDNEGLILKVEAYEGTAEAVIYWVTEDGDAAERPAAGSYTQFKLYFSIDGGDDTELTNSTKGEVGLIDLPSVSTTDNGDGCGYRLHVEGLPSKLQYVSPETEAMEGVDQREDGELLSVSWKIVPQDDLAEYTLHEVSDPAEVIYASKGAGWYYVKEAEQPSAPAEETEDEITVTGWRDSYSKTVFWADNQNEGEVRPSVGNYPLPKLYFTYTVTETEDSADMDPGENTSEDNENAGDEKTAGETDGSDSVEGSLTETVSGIELTEESMKQVGLTVMPEIRITDNGDSYTLTIGENILPASFERTRDGVKGTGSVEWEIVLQEVTGYDLVEVTEEDLNERPDEFFYAEATGTYYVIEGLEAEKEEETLEITGWAEESRSTVYWMDYNNGYGTRPDQVTPELYFTMSRKDGQEEEGCGKRLQLTEENLSKLGLERMPEFRMESKGTAQKDGEELQLVIKGAGGDPVPFTVDVYEVILDGKSLPTALTRTVGEEKTEYIVEWEVLPAEVEYYTRMEVTEDNLAQMQAEHPYVTEAGWYYVLDMGEEIAAYVEPTVTVDESENVLQNIYWMDNNNEAGSRPETEDYLKNSKPVLHYVIKEGDVTLADSAWDFSDEANGWDQFGITDLMLENVDLPVLSISVQNGAWSLSAGTLPTEVTSRDVYGKTHTYTIEWTFEPSESAPDGYEGPEVITEGESGAQAPGWYYVKQTEFELDIVFRMGAVSDIGEVRDALLDDFGLVIKNRAGVEQEIIPLSALAEQGYELSLGTPEGDGVRSLTLTISDLENYNLDGTRISYTIQRVKQENGTTIIVGNEPLTAEQLPDTGVEDEDNVTVEFDNTNVPNHSGDTGEAYSGGTLNLTLTGETAYAATKKWLDPLTGGTDAEKESRPGGMFELWRFREGTSYTNAAAVWEDGEILSREITKKEDVQEINFDDLPKYDAEGYRYIYVVREYLDSTEQYSQVFGDVTMDENGVVTINDTLEGYADGATRDSLDINVYNKGVLSNRIRGNVSTEGTKIWKASAFQADLSDVRVVFELQCREATENGEDTGWRPALDEDGRNITEEIKGFDAEMLAGLSFTKNVSRYDALGRELEYRWVEAGVYQGEGSTENLLKEDKNGNLGFDLTLADGRKIHYTSESVESKTEVSTVITNSVRNTIEYDVYKEWADNREPEEIQINLYRAVSGGAITDGKPLLTFKMDKEGNLIPTSIEWDERQMEDWEEAEKGCSNGTENDWHVQITGLAEFDPDGREYEYVLLEQLKEGDNRFPIYETNRVTDPTEDYGNYETTVINPIGPGQRVMVRKDWIDDSDTLHREDVTFAVYVKPGAAMQEEDKNKCVGEITLKNGVWYDYVGINDSNYTADEVYILEIKVGDTELTWPNEAKYGAYAGKKLSEMPREPLDGDVIIYNTDHHRYQVTYKEDEIAGEIFKIAENRRLGNVDITVTKNWKDGNGAGRQALIAELNKIQENDKTPPKLVLYLEFDETMGVNHDYVIDYIENTVQVAQEGDLVKILNKEGEPAAAIQKLLTVNTTQTSSDSSEYYFFNLPKYDANGTTVRYEVREIWVDENNQEIKDLSTEYPGLAEVWAEFSTKVEESYTPDRDHHDENDVQTIKITNQRGGSKTVYWHKIWNDAYNQSVSRRPDIFLNIYRVSNAPAEGEEPRKPELYKANYHWEYDEEEDTLNEWDAKFEGLPKYDDNGYEYTYYAIENTSIKTDFDYVAVVYSYNNTEIGTEFGTGEDSTGEDSDDEDSAVAEGIIYPLEEEKKDDKLRYGLKEEGTFINNVYSEITISGQKIWAGLPSDFSKDHLPTIKLTLVQTSDNLSRDVAELTMDAATMAEGGNRFLMKYLGWNVMEMTDGNLEVNWNPTNPDPNADENEKGKYSQYKEPTRIPKYDEKGGLYQYSIREEIIWSVEDGKPFKGQSVTGGSDNTYTLTNTYSSDKGMLKAKKLLYLEAGMLDGLEDGEATGFPSVTFEVYRRYKFDEEQVGKDSAWTKIASETWDASEIKGQYQGKNGDANGVWLENIFTFENLDIYAPNGSQYQYQIKEVKTSEGAYNTWVKMKDIPVAEADKTVTDEAAAESEEINGKWYVSSGELSLQPDSEPLNVAVTFLNKKPDNPGAVLKLTGTKKWNDNGDAVGLRPEFNVDDWKEHFTLWRYAEPSQSEGSNGIPLEEVAPNTYTFEWRDEGDTWTYVITAKKGYRLDRYASNDMPWIYVVREDWPDSPYVSTSENDPEQNDYVEAAEKDESSTDSSTIGTLTNSLLTQKSFRKEWQYADDGAPITENTLGYKLRVTFSLEVKAEDESSWSRATEYFVGYSALRDEMADKVLGGENGADVTDPIWINRGTFSNLPTHIKKVDKVVRLSYRVVESKIEYGAETDFSDPASINEIKVSINSEGKYTFTPVGTVGNPFAEGSFSDSGNLTTSTNKIDDTSLTIEKKWEDDEENAYGTRPGTDNEGEDWEACFVIQRQEEGSAEWENVLREGGTVMIVYITGQNSEPSGSITINHLPQISPDGKTYTYRARELQPDIDGNGVDQHYGDGTVDDGQIIWEDTDIENGYPYFNSAYTVDYDDGVLGVTTATNTMNSKDIYAQKIWQGSERVDVTLSLQYLKAADEKDEKNWVTIAEVTVDGKTDQSNLPYYETAGTKGKVATWNAIFGCVPVRMPGSYLPANTSETKYRVVETLVTSQPEKYKLISSGGSGTQNAPFTFTNTTVTSLSIIKNWYPTTTQKKGQVTVGIYRTTESDMTTWEGGNADQYIENEEWKKITLSEGNGWKETLSDLIKYDSQGNQIFYYAREISVGGVPVSDTSFPFKVVYEDEKTNQENETQTTISNIELTDITATKTWIDNSDAYQTRPDSLSLTLYRTTETGNWQEIPENKWETVNVEPEVTQNGDVWTYLYKGVPLTDDDGLSYTYKVEENDLVEVSSKEYRLAIAEDAPDEAKGDWYVFSRGTTDPKLELVNTLDGQKKITLRKVWEDNNDPDLRKEIEIKLVGRILDGSQVVYDHTWKLNSSMLEKLIYGVIFKQPDTWIYELTVDKYDAQQRYITYTAEEVKVPEGYDVYYETDRVFGNADELMHITFTARNVREGNLTVTKTVSGGNGDIWKDWRFTVTLSDKTVNGTYGEMTFKDGVATFTLKHGQTKTATGLPGGITYTVSEEEANQNGYTTTASGAGGTIPIGGTATAAFTNHNDPEEERRDDDDDTPPTTVSANAVPPVSALPIIPWITGAINGAGVPTGDMAAPLLYIGLAVLALAVIVIVLITGKKRRKKRRTSGQAGRKRSRRKNRK